MADNWKEINVNYWDPAGCMKTYKIGAFNVEYIYQVTCAGKSTNFGINYDDENLTTFVNFNNTLESRTN